MNDFFQLYRSHFIYSAAVILLVLLLLFLTNRLHRWMLAKEERRFPGVNLRPIFLIRRILNILWIVMGVLGLCFIFMGEDHYETLLKEFRLVVYLGFIAIATIASAVTVNLWFKHNIQKKTAENDDPTGLKFFSYVAVISIYVVGAFFALLAFPAFRGIAQTALGGAGVIALIAGVASQEALSNLVGGIFIISFKPFKIGDTIKVTDNMVGTVTDITLRHTLIRNYENKMIVIPNAIINKEKLVNYNLGELKCCERIEIGISYDSDVDLAKSILSEVCENHPLLLDNRSEADKQNGNPLVRTALISFNDSSVTIRAWCWAASYGDAFRLKCDVLEAIKKRFSESNIEIPVPYRKVVFEREVPAENGSSVG